eukprot:3302711-Rhodomonas_salina.1
MCGTEKAYGAVAARGEPAARQRRKLPVQIYPNLPKSSLLSVRLVLSRGLVGCTTSSVAASTRLVLPAFLLSYAPPTNDPVLTFPYGPTRDAARDRGTSTNCRLCPYAAPTRCPVLKLRYAPTRPYTFSIESALSSPPAPPLLCPLSRYGCTVHCPLSCYGRFLPPCLPRPDIQKCDAFLIPKM